MIRLLIASLFLCMSAKSYCQTKLNITTSAVNDYKKADKKLNEVYYKILKEYKVDSAFIKNIKLAQSLWIKFRDAQAKAMYPDRPEGYYGSSFAMCWYNYLQQLTEERTEKLNIG